jgi:general stress protein CsbA
MFERRSARAYVAIFLVVLLFGSMHERSFAHGSLSIEKDMCKLQLGKYSLHFTGYQPEATGSEEFCEDIPKTGSVVIALDAIDAELREMPIEVRIIQDSGEKGDAEAVTVLHLAPQSYPTGSISITHQFDQPGKFVGLVTAGEKGEHVSRFPFSVAISKPAYQKYLPIILVVLLGFALYLFSGRVRRSAEARANSSSNKLL